MLNEAREEDAEGMLRPKPKEQPMPKLCEAWATWDVGFCRREKNRAGRTKFPRAVAKRERSPGADVVSRMFKT